MDNFSTSAGRADISRRQGALIADLGLLGMAVLISVTELNATDHERN